MDKEEVPPDTEERDGSTSHEHSVEDKILQEKGCIIDKRLDLKTKKLMTKILGHNSHKMQYSTS